MTGYDLERYLNVRRAGGATFSPDGDRVAFRMNTTGTDQVWSLGAPGAWPDQLTFYGERVTFVEWSPTRDELAFGMDEGGNERVQLYRLAGDGSAVVPLTDRPGAKHRWGGWSHSGGRFAFTSNRRDVADFDVYVQSRDETGDDADLVFEGGGWFDVAGWDPDDERLALHEARSSYDQDVHVLDLDTGDTEHLTPSPDPTRYLDVAWVPAGDALYLATDRGADTLYLAQLDAGSGDLEVVEAGGQSNVEGFELDEETGRFVFSRNTGGFTELAVGELTGETTYRTLPEPDLPRGVRGGVDFGPVAERFAVTATARTENANVYVVDAVTGEATRWTDATTAGIPPETFVEPRLVHFESFDDREIPAFFTEPANAPTGETPVIVDIHGGPESQRRPSFDALVQFYVDRGYAYFEPNVRGSSGYGREYARLDDVERRMDSVRDVHAGVAWLHDQPVVDPDRIVAMGASYGGFMVLALLTEYPDLWAAGVDIVGIANFVTFLENTGDWRRALREAEYGSLAADREFLERISPVNNVDRIRAPLFVAHGENDPRVPVDEARQIATRAREHVPVETLFFDDEGHGFTKLENRLEAYSAIAEFLETHV